MLAHRQPGLSAADDKRINVFNRHALLHIAMPEADLPLALTCIRIGQNTT
jgi:hypothetical protein